jgi:SAM-dependent methyltransferase
VKDERKPITRQHIISSMKRMAVESGLKEKDLERFLRKYALQYGTLLLLRNLQAADFRLRPAENTIEYMFSRSRTIEAIENRLKGDEDILSVGCGSGLVEVSLADCGYRVQGVDTDIMSLRVAKRFAADMGVAGRCRFRRVKDERLPFENGTFDAILYSHSLHDVRDQKLSLKESRRVLRPGGLVVIFEDRKELRELMKTVRAAPLILQQRRVLLPGRSSKDGLVSPVVQIVLRKRN